MSVIINPGSGGSSGSLTVGTTTIIGGAANQLLYDNGGTLEEAVVGTGLSLSGGTLTATGGGGIPVLSGNTTYYVNPSTGSDSYNGLSPTFTGGINGPFATPQHASNVASAVFANSFSITIQLADATYTNPEWVIGPLTGTTAPLAIVGNPTTPSNVTLVRNSSSTIPDVMFINSFSNITLNGIRIKSDYRGINLQGQTVCLLAHGGFLEFEFVAGSGNDDAMVTLNFGNNFGGNGSGTISTFGNGNAGDWYAFIYAFTSTANVGNNNFFNWNATVDFTNGFGACFYFQNAGLDAGFTIGGGQPYGGAGTGTVAGLALWLEDNATVTMNTNNPATFMNGAVLWDNTASSSYNFNSNTPAWWFPRVDTPSSGDTVTMAVWQGLEVLNPAAGLATLTIVLPSNSGLPGAVGRVTISTTWNVAAISYTTSDGSTPPRAPASLLQGQSFSCYYDPVGGAWWAA